MAWKRYRAMRLLFPFWTTIETTKTVMLQEWQRIEMHDIFAVCAKYYDI
jgi:hypothetical protein